MTNPLPTIDGDVGTWGQKLNAYLEKAVYGPVFNVRDYGAKGDNASNDSPPIQAAINAAHAAGGGIVYFPLPTEGSYRIVEGLNLDDMENIRLEGVMSGRSTYNAPTGVILRHAGPVTATPMLSWQSVAHVPGALYGCGIKGLEFDCQWARPGLILADLYAGTWDDIGVTGPTGVGIDLLGNRGLGFQSNDMRNISIRVYETGAIGMRWGRVVLGGPNVSMTTFYNLHIFHNTGVGLDCGSSDSNIIYGFNIGSGFTPGSAPGILLRAGNGGNEPATNHLLIGQVITPLVARATGFTHAATNNVVILTTNNGQPPLTIEPGATLTYISDNGKHIYPTLPTADPHFAGQLWNSAGTLKVSAG